MSNPPKSLSPKELEEIEMMAGLGLRYEDIASIKDMSDATLKKYAMEHLRKGKAKARAQVAQTAYKLAVSGKTPAMTMFWLKTQARWRENHPEPEDATRLQDAIRQASHPTKPVIEFLAAALEKVGSGELDPKTASAIASVSGAFLKSVSQGQLEERLAALESLASSSNEPPLDLGL